MLIYIVTSSYMENFLFGSFSTVLKAREAIHNFIMNSGYFTHYEDVGDYSYIAYDNDGENYFFSILSDVLDAE